WVKFTYLTKGLIWLRFRILVLDMDLVTARGERSIPAIRAWPNSRSRLPVSLMATTMALWPANRPLRTMTTRPGVMLRWGPGGGRGGLRERERERQGIRFHGRLLWMERMH